MIASPILDEMLFLNDTLPRIIAHGFRYGDAESVLTLYVLALGQLAIEAATGAPIGLVNGEPSGLCGGTAQRPPALDIFNEGRARVGELLVRGELASVQALLLQGTYFEASACHVEYWRSVMEASLTCQVLTQGAGRSWTFANDDLLRRSFWTCVVGEEFYHVDLDPPRTSIAALSDQIQLPRFGDALSASEIGDAEEVQRLPAFYFLAKVGLRRVISDIHSTIQRCKCKAANIAQYSPTNCGSRS